MVPDMTSRFFCAALLTAIIALPSVAQDDNAGKKRAKRGQQNNVATQMLKQLEDLQLTDEQVAKLKEHAKVASAKMKEIRDEAGITPELMKKRLEAQKSMKDSDKKGKELAAAINEAAGYNEAQVAATTKMNAVRNELKKQIIAMLSDEQKAKLSPAFKRGTASKGGAAKGKKNRKKKDNE